MSLLGTVLLLGVFLFKVLEELFLVLVHIFNIFGACMISFCGEGAWEAGRK